MPTIQKAAVEGDVLVVTGSGFGNKPQVTIFDDFDRGTAGQAIPIGPATVGSWVKAGSAVPKFGKDADGNGYLKATYATTWLEYLEAKLGPNATNIFMSFKWRVPEGKLFPGENSADKLNWKVTWIMNTGTQDGDLYIPVCVERPDNWLIDGNDSPYGKYFPAPEAPIKGQWHHWQFAAKASSTNGSMEMWETRSNGVIKHIDERKPTVNGTDAWNIIHVPGYGRSYPGQEVHMDDFYLAEGPDAKARIALGNNPSYHSSSKMRVLPPISWTDSEIRVKKQALEYVTVFDAAGNPSNTIKIQTGTVDPAPPPPPDPMPITESYPFTVNVNPNVTIKGTVEIKK